MAVFNEDYSAPEDHHRESLDTYDCENRAIVNGLSSMLGISAPD